MERLKYLFMIATVLLIFKAMFLDDYLKNQDKAETNSSFEAAQTSVNGTEEKNGTTRRDSVSSVPQNKELPIDTLGKFIADKINL